MIGIYHSADLDGLCCGAIMKYKYPDIELIGIDHGQEFPWNKIQGQDVIMADFSLKPFSQMIELKNRCKSFKWFDHHKTVIERLYESGEAFDGTQAEGLAGCELLWTYLYPNKPMPEAVILLGRYDCWDHQNPNILPFQYGMKLYNTDPSNPEILPCGNRLWTLLFISDSIDPHQGGGYKITDVIIQNGKNILKYQKQKDKEYCKALAFETELNGLKLITVNVGITNSKLFDLLWDQNKYDAMCAFVWKDRQWKFSLYTDRKDVDILSIAKSYGGGGHQQACGFQLKELPEGFLK